MNQQVSILPKKLLPLCDNVGRSSSRAHGMAIIDMVELLHVVDVGMESDMDYFIIEHDGMETVGVGRDLKWIR